MVAVALVVAMAPEASGTAGEIGQAAEEAAVMAPATVEAVAVKVQAVEEVEEVPKGVGSEAEGAVAVEVEVASIME